jgi:hypothetical protein
MGENSAKTTKITKGSSRDLSFEFPSSEKITIDKVNLSFQLMKFRNAVTDSISLDSIVNFLITLVAVWVPMFTSDFKTFLGYNPVLIKGAYVGFAIFATLYSFYRFAIKPLWFYGWNNSTASQDPEKMAQIILEKCDKK